MLSQSSRDYVRTEKANDEIMSNSSGISLSFNTERTEKILSSASKRRLKQIAENHEDIQFRDGMRSNFHQGQGRQSLTPFFPKVESKPKPVRKGNL